MWIFNKDKNKWVSTDDRLLKNDFDFLKEELSSTRLYSKCLSGATYLPINNLDNIYDILGEYEPRNWFISSDGSPYTNTIKPKDDSPINNETSFDYYTKYLSEYGLTLKNLFTPDRLIKDSVKNYIYVDIATTEEIPNLLEILVNPIFDGVRLVDGHRILVKDQKTREVLPFDVDPETYFDGNYYIVENFGATIEYEYFNSDNGIYTYNDSVLTKTEDLSNYEDCVRYSVNVKLGTINTGKQFHLSRLLNGYYPTTSLDEPIEFVEKNNWILRNRVDYNNLFEINYYDVIKHSNQTYNFSGITYSIPERTISIGEFGIILNTQTGISNIIPNKYKTNLRSITDTDIYYWICGDNGILLRVRKHDFNIEKIDVNTIARLKSISFFDNLNGVVVGDLNTILITNDGGNNWDLILIDEFDSFNYNKVLFNRQNRIYIGGNTGVFIELEEDITGWSAFKRRISRFIDEFEDYVLVDNINDLYYTNLNNWGLSFSYPIGNTHSTNIDKELLFIVTNDSKIIVHDINDSINNFDFLYLDFNDNGITKDSGDITNIVRVEGSATQSSKFIFSSDNGISSFNINDFMLIGVDNLSSNTILSTQSCRYESNVFVNKIFNYNGEELIICGNDSLLKRGTYSTIFNFEILDETFDSRLKSKMLFTDYDVASKLNFFTDSGEYRLPNPITIELPSVIPSKTFQVLTSFSLGTFTVLPIEIVNVEPSPKEIRLRMDITALEKFSIADMIINLVSPNGNVINVKKPNTPLTTSINFDTIFSTNTIYDNILTSYDGLFQMDKVLEIGNNPYFSNVNSIEDLLVDGNPNGEWYLSIFRPGRAAGGTTLNFWDITFIYNVDNGISLTASTSCLDFIPLTHDESFEKNWLTYWKDRGKTFEYYASSDALSESTKVLMSNKFCYSKDTHNRIELNSITNDVSTVSKLAPSILDEGMSRYNRGINDPITFIFDHQVYINDYIMVIRLQDDFNVEVGDVIRIESDIVDSNFIVNRIEPVTIRSLSKNRYNFIYLFTNFNDNIVNELVKVGKIFVTNLNKYDSLENLENNFNIHPISNAYELSYRRLSNDVNISAKFNNISSYYNLATNVVVFGDQSGDFGEINVTGTMSYSDGFLNFGYTPTYNILDYLEGLNDVNTQLPKFYADKEYYAMPDYRGIPLANINSQTPDEAFVDSSLISYDTYTTQTNKILFGEGLKLEWESIFINTFVDVSIYQTSDYFNATEGVDKFTTERLLVLNKYFDETLSRYVVEFNTIINFITDNTLYYIDIISRRKLIQISKDLQELNNIQRSQLSTSEIIIGNTYNNYERKLNFKISTDSYTKVLLSDVDTVRELSAIVYTDYKNELAMNITRLDRQYNIPILNTSNFNGNLFISCSQKHDLRTGEGVVLEFNGGTQSSQVLNQQYFGYHSVIVVDESSFYVEIPYGSETLVGNDSGFVKYTKKDPFLNYQPIDIIDVGVDKKGKRSIELSIDNLKLENDVYSLSGVDFTKHRFRLVDGLNVETLSILYPWIFEAEISNAIIGLDGNDLVWYKGTWECGRWFGGRWISGTWMSGDWYGGVWDSKRIKDRLISVDVDNRVSDPKLSTWLGGRWYDGTWNSGTWVDGRWYGGTWNSGKWNNGIWNNGIWNNGEFSGGVWVIGTWNNGIFNTNNSESYWINGKWSGGDFENGLWYNGIFEEKNSISRFGTKAYNSRTANWRSGKWLSGSFYSRLNKNNSGEVIPSITNTYSIWSTGDWYSGDWYGGVAYNIDFRLGTWNGGILDEIQVVGINKSVGNNYLVLNGIFSFNRGDEITIVDNENSEFSSIGSLETPKKYKISDIYVDDINKRTRVFVNLDNILTSNISEVDTGLRVVSRFRNTNWKSGIWTNGIYESGLWQGGIWYNGIFNANWIS